MFQCYTRPGTIQKQVKCQSFKHFVLCDPTRCRLFGDTVSTAVIIYCGVVTGCFSEPERTGRKLLQFKTLNTALTWKGLVKSQKTLVRVAKCPIQDSNQAPPNTR